MAYDDFIPLEDIEVLVPHLQARGISKIALGPGGFLEAFRRAKGDPDKLSPEWIRKREGFIRRHRAQAKENREAWWERRSGREEDELDRRTRKRPTRRHGALIAWAHSPTVKQLDRWLDDQGL